MHRTFTSPNLVTGRLYKFKHVALNKVGESVASTTQSIYACVAPSGFERPVVTTSTETSITITWKDPKDNGGCPITGFKVFRDQADETSPST